MNANESESSEAAVFSGDRGPALGTGSFVCHSVHSTDTQKITRVRVRCTTHTRARARSHLYLAGGAEWIRWFETRARASISLYACLSARLRDRGVCTRAHKQRNQLGGTRAYAAFCMRAPEEERGVQWFRRFYYSALYANLT